MNTKSIRISLLASVILAVASSASALQTISDSLLVTQGLTVRDDALLEGSTAFGRLPSQSTAGYVTDVYQGVSTVAREEIVPAHEGTEMVWVDDYGTINITIYGDTWGWVNRDVWVPDEYDGEGNISTPGHFESRQTWEVVGSYSYPGTTWGVTGSHQESQPVWIPEQRNTYTDTVFGIPVVRHTGQRHDVIWTWRNYNPYDATTRELMELSPAGISIPHPDAADGSMHAVLTSTNFEQSYTTPANTSGPYQSYGVKMQKDKIVAWFDNGQMTANMSDPNAPTYDVAVTSSKSAQYKPEEVLIQDTQPAPDGLSTQTVSTRIAAGSSTFGGTVAVNGALLVQPQGDLTMGGYTNGPQP